MKGEEKPATLSCGILSLSTHESGSAALRRQPPPQLPSIPRPATPGRQRRRRQGVGTSKRRGRGAQTKSTAQDEWVSYPKSAYTHLSTFLYSHYVLLEAYRWRSPQSANAPVWTPRRVRKSPQHKAAALILATTTSISTSTLTLTSTPPPPQPRGRRRRKESPSSQNTSPAAPANNERTATAAAAAGRE